MSERKNMTGALFKNTKKETDSHPEYTGPALIHGQEFYVSAWINDGPKGKYMSLKFKPKEATRGTEPAKQDAFGLSDDEQDRIPF
jgi:hypothetical protein